MGQELDVSHLVTILKRKSTICIRCVIMDMTRFVCSEEVDETNIGEFFSVPNGGSEQQKSSATVEDTKQ
jgi:hypothetical protein